MDPRSAQSIFTRGAVDLGALRPSSPPPQAAGAGNGAGSGPGAPAGIATGGPPAGGGVTVIDVSEATFQSEVLERSLVHPSISGSTLYNCACGYARLGETDKALGLLERWVETGTGSAGWVRADRDLDSLRENPRFTALVARLERGKTTEQGAPEPAEGSGWRKSAYLY